ncbi:MAG: BrnT family toxin [Moraxellaceae bacterium]|nr:BrnT family toxin [Moraxellaceae bacterium]
MQFSWDKNKEQTNIEKHGLSFQEAMLVFADPFALCNQDRIENHEQRWQTIGKINDIAMIVLVAHTWTDDGKTEYIRIISARQANKKEVQDYERNYYSAIGY